MPTTASRWNVPGKDGPSGELFFFLMKTEPTTHEASDDEDGRSFSNEEGEHSVEKLQALPVCASCVQSALARIPTGRRAVSGGVDLSLFVGCVIPPSGLNGSLFLTMFLTNGQFCPLLQLLTRFSHSGRAGTVRSGMCDGRRVQVSK